MKYIIVLFFLHPGQTWEAGPIDKVIYDNYASCRLDADKMLGTFYDKTLVIPSCMEAGPDA